MEVEEGKEVVEEEVLLLSLFEEEVERERDTEAPKNDPPIEEVEVFSGDGRED